MAKRIKGKYVALVEIDFDIKDNLSNTILFDKMKEHVTGYAMTDSVCRALMDCICSPDIGTVTVTKQLADLYEVEEDG